MSVDFPLYDVVQDGRAKQHWKMQLLGDRMVFYSSDGAGDYQVMRQDVPHAVYLLEWSKHAELSVKVGKRRTYKLTPEVAAATRDWIGPMTKEHLSAVLKRSLWTAVSVGILLLTMSFSRAPGRGLQFEPGFLLLGLLLFGSVFLSAVRPHRACLLVYSACFLLVAGMWAYQVAFDHRHWLVAVGAIANFCLGLAALFEFRRFRNIESTHAESSI